jgi:hypothetical protein
MRWYSRYSFVAILDDIRAALAAGRYRITQHGAEEMLADALAEVDVKAATASGEMIEDYPTAFPLPACLVLGLAAGGPVHAVWALDPGPCYAVLVTVYRPDPARWAPDFRTRTR